MNKPRRAFTLIEVMVATVIAGVVAMIVQRTLAQIQRSTAAITAQAVTVNSQANGLRVLRNLISNMVPPTSFSRVSDSSKVVISSGLSGNPSEMQFTSWCQLGANAETRCSRHLEVSADTVASHEPTTGTTFHWSLSDSSATSGRVVLRHSNAPLELRYLASANDGGHWSDRWMPNVSLPAAIGLIAGNDTILLRVAGSLR